MFKVKHRKTKARCEICSKLTIKTPERRQISSVIVTKSPVTITEEIRRCSGVFIVNFEHISHLVPVFLFLTLSS